MGNVWFISIVTSSKAVISKFPPVSLHIYFKYNIQHPLVGHHLCPYRQNHVLLNISSQVGERIFVCGVVTEVSPCRIGVSSVNNSVISETRTYFLCSLITSTYFIKSSYLSFDIFLINSIDILRLLKMSYWFCKFFLCCCFTFNFLWVIVCPSYFFVTKKYTFTI